MNARVCFYGPENKQTLLFSFTELTERSLQPGREVLSARYDLNLWILLKLVLVLTEITIQDTKI